MSEDFIIANGVLTKYNGPGGSVVIPAGVRKIGDDAFQNCAGIRGGRACRKGRRHD